MADPDWMKAFYTHCQIEQESPKVFIIYSMKFNEKKVSFTQQKMNEFSNVLWSEISCFLVRNLVKLEENGHF